MTLSFRFRTALPIAVRPPGTAETADGPVEQKEPAVEIIERRTAFVANQNMLDVRIERRGRGSIGPLVDNAIARSRTVIAFARHTGKGDDPPAGRRQQPRRSRRHGSTVEAAA